MEAKVWNNLRNFGAHKQWIQFESTRSGFPHRRQGEINQVYELLTVGYS